MGYLKGLGSLCIMFVTIAIGWHYQQRFKNRPVFLRQFMDALNLLEAEMIYSQLPLQAAFKLIAERIQYPVNHFFLQISQALEHTDEQFFHLWSEQLNQFIK